MILESVRIGVTFVHTGSLASFHGGGERTAGLDLTPLAELMPVELEHENDVFLKSFYRAGLQPNDFASPEVHHVSVAASAPGWMRDVSFANLAPDNFHMLKAKKESDTLLELGGRPLLVSGHFGKGRTFAYLGFSPESSVRAEHKPLVLDRAIRESPEGKLFAIISGTLLVLASGEPPAGSVGSVVDSRTKPLFESLMEHESAERPRLSANWGTDSAGHPVGHIRVENGDHFIFGLRLRLDSENARSGRTLALWSAQYFDLFSTRSC